MNKRALWWAAGILSVAIAGGVAPSVDAAPKKPAKDVPLKVNASIKPKVDARIAPFTWGMSSADTLKQVDKMIDEAYAVKTEKVYNPKIVASLEKQKDKDKLKAKASIVEFTGTGLSGYEIKTPHEFTYKNKETALAVSRPGGGERSLFFINDRLWKVFDVVALGVAATGKVDPADDAIVVFEKQQSYDDAVKRMISDFGGDGGKAIAPNTMTASYFGTIGAIPATHIWSDGKTQVRLVDYTTREDLTVKSAAIAYEEIATLEQLPTYRVNVEQKTTDAMVDKAGAAAPSASSDKVTPKKK